MRYITVEQFLKQSEEVQETLIDWWKNNIEQYDLFYRKRNEERQKYIVIKVDKYEIVTVDLRHKDSLREWRSPSASIDSWNIQYIDDIIPLLTETQLREFIEEKSNSKIDISCDSKTVEGSYVYQITCWEFIDNNNFFKEDFMFKVEANDLLQAYFKVVCQIAEGDNING